MADSFLVDVTSWTILRFDQRAQVMIQQHQSSGHCVVGQATNARPSDHPTQRVFAHKPLAAAPPPTTSPCNSSRPLELFASTMHTVPILVLIFFCIHSLHGAIQQFYIIVCLFVPPILCRQMHQGSPSSVFYPRSLPSPPPLLGTRRINRVTTLFASPAQPNR